MGVRKIAKDDPLFDALGALDELNSWLGVCRASVKLKAKSYKLKAIQETLFIAQAEIAMLGMKKRYTLRVTRAKTEELEREIRRIDAVVPNIKKFIIPGGAELSAKLDYARTLARRAERTLVCIKANPDLLAYLNRLSGYLFALARLVNFRLNIKEESPSYRP